MECKAKELCCIKKLHIYAKEMRMNLIQAKLEDLEEIYSVVQNTIRNIYPKYYAAGVVDFFCNLHSKENILRDLKNQNVFCIKDADRIVATGTFAGNHITRVFVLPEYQRKGIGSFIFDEFERNILSQYEAVEIDASLAACKMYENRNYKTVRHESVNCEDGSILVYEVMEKRMERK